MNPYPFETGIYRPPSEGGSDSLLVRFTRNCPWNHCTFCAMYKTVKFEVRTLGEIQADIDAMARLAKDLFAASETAGSPGTLCREGIISLMRQAPELEYHHGFAMLVHWLMAGGTTAFIQDANSLIMKPDDLAGALSYLKTTFGSITRITSYARSRTLVQRSLDHLIQIRKAGLDRLHLGLETGDPDLLKQVKKGVTPRGLIEGGQKAMAAGFQISEYWMPGLGGKEKTHGHARNTAAVLNQINPHYIRSRPFRVIAGTPVQETVKKGQLKLLSNREQLLEIKEMVTALDVTSRVCFDHAGNHWRTPDGSLVFSHDYEGYQFPEDKPKVLERIEMGLDFRA